MRLPTVIWWVRPQKLLIRSLPKPKIYPKSHKPVVIGYEFKHNFVTRVVREKSGLSIPATSCECERVFSGAKKTISDYRGRLGADIVETLECDAAWLRAEL